MSILNKIVNYYQDVTDNALIALSKLKTFNFRKMLVNNQTIKVVQKNFSKKGQSKEAKKLINDYNKRINNMFVYAKIDYDRTFKKIKLAKKANDDILLQKLLNDYANRGIIGFVAKNGAKWNIETYSNMLTCHINNELVRLKETERIIAKGKNLVRISNHNTICELCIPYEGKVLTFAELEEAKKNGLYHPNCKHYHTEV